MEKYYITTPIYYVNDVASIGHAYTNTAADVLARWHRLKGKDVFFLTGTDENSQKTVKAAKEKFGENIDRKQIQVYADNMAKTWKEGWKKINISNNGFIRTTDTKHKRVVNEFYSKVFKKGDIYKGEYKGLYCEGCESFITEKELIDGNCQYHKKPPKKITEENYFFKLSKYQDQILEHIEKNPNFIKPRSRRNEVISFLKEEGARDISISRPLKKWGIPLPNDENHCFWVWFDALVNYISGAENYWPANLHMLAKDILRFHCVIWIGMLISAGYPLPEKLFVHGFLTINGEKMSKSLGNAINPIHLTESYGVDPIRYTLLREISFGEDGDFSEDAVVSRLNNELANDLGNLVSRVSTLTEKNFKERISKTELDEELVSKLDFKKIESFIEKIELHNALSEIWKFVNECNKYVNEKEIWHLKGKELNKSLYTLLESIRVLSLVLTPFLPETASKISSHLGQENKSFENVKFGLVESYLISKSEVLFKKIEIKKKQEENKLVFEDLNLRVAKIKEVKDHPNADKLYLLNLDLGGQELNIVSGLKQHYKKEELVEKNIIVIANLERSTIRGVESEGMLLAAEENSKLSLLTSKDIPGSKVFVKKSSYKEKELVKFKEFKSFKFITKEGKVYYNGLPLKTDKEEIGLDKEMSDGLTVE